MCFCCSTIGMNVISYRQTSGARGCADQLSTTTSPHEREVLPRVICCTQVGTARPLFLGQSCDPRCANEVFGWPDTVMVGNRVCRLKLKLTMYCVPGALRNAANQKFPDSDGPLHKNRQKNHLQPPASLDIIFFETPSLAPSRLLFAKRENRLYALSRQKLVQAYLYII